MCGIVGCFHKNEEIPISKEVLIKMLSKLHHRGPDESGIYLEDFIGLAHARLSIIDLKSGQQPMPTYDGLYWITFNGEIFNYIELRKELILKGHKFKTQSDTEVLINLYKEYGPSCLSKLNGQFAFAIWDRNKKELFLARDRVGIRPLFYTKTGNKFLFASEIKALLEHPETQPELSPEALEEVFTFWTALSPKTVFHEIFELPPGHFMVVGKNKMHIQQYWDLAFPTEGNHRIKSIQEAIEGFEEIFEDAVKIRLRADVPVGAYLSGGIDSSITTAFIKKIHPDILRTFSIGFSEKEYDESDFQRIAVDYLKTNHSEITCSLKDISQVFPKVIWHAETPITRTAPAPMYLLSKLVRNENYKVVVTGEGADEMLAGYNIFKEMQIRRFWAKDPDSRIRPLLLKKLYPYLSHLKDLNNNVLKLFFGYKLTDTDSNLYSHIIRWKNSNRIRNHFSDDYKELIGSNDLLQNIENQLPYDFEKYDPLAKAQWLESKIFMSGYLLSSQGDRMAMANSIEGRYPFLDHRIIEYSLDLSPDHKLNGLNEKFLLKKMMNKRLPQSILNRPKQAYRAPTSSSFLNRIPEYLHDILSPDQLKKCGIFNPESIQSLIKKLKSGKQISEVDNMSLTGIISTQILYNQFILKRNTISHNNKRQTIRFLIHNKANNSVEITKTEI